MKLRRVLVLVAGAVVSATVVSVLTSSPATAHGAMMIPGSRTWLCYQDGLSSTGQIVPVNPACGAAVAQSGANSLYNWFGVLRSDGGGRTRGFLPTGSLCSGGNPGFAGFDLSRADWPLTHLTSGATIEYNYSNWAAHPGSFHLYVTRDSWSPTRPLGWDDLEDTPFLSVTNPRAVGSPGSVGGHYYWTGTLPGNKSGRHLLYSVWSRSDSQETFYGCSDVTFDGGNGQVTGVGRGGTPSPTGPTPSSTGPTPGPPSPTPSPTAPRPTATAPSPTDPSPTAPAPRPTPTNPGGISCSATVRIDNAWPGGFQATVTVRNTGPNPLTPWVASWHLNPAVLQGGWNATVTQSGHMVTAVAPSWNGTLAPGASASVGFTATGPATPAPATT